MAFPVGNELGENERDKESGDVGRSATFAGDLVGPAVSIEEEFVVRYEFGNPGLSFGANDGLKEGSGLELSVTNIEFIAGNINRKLIRAGVVLP